VMPVVGVHHDLGLSCGDGRASVNGQKGTSSMSVRLWLDRQTRRQLLSHVARKAAIHGLKLNGACGSNWAFQSHFAGFFLGGDCSAVE
jgi:hypothetical protein